MKIFLCYTRRDRSTPYMPHAPLQVAQFNEVPRQGEVVALVVRTTPQTLYAFFQVDRVVYDPRITANDAVLYCTFDADQLPHTMNR